MVCESSWMHNDWGHVLRNLFNKWPEIIFTVRACRRWRDVVGKNNVTICKVLCEEWSGLTKGLHGAQGTQANVRYQLGTACLCENNWECKLIYWPEKKRIGSTSLWALHYGYGTETGEILKVTMWWYMISPYMWWYMWWYTEKAG